VRDVQQKNPFSMEKLALLVPITNILILLSKLVSNALEVETTTKQPKLVIAQKLLLSLLAPTAFSAFCLNILTFKRKNV